LTSKGDYARAIADYSEAVRLNPRYSAGFVGRGLANVYAGALPKALADLSQAAELDPKDAYTALWIDIVNKRSNLASRLPQAIARLDMTRWPAPVIRMYLGEMTPEALLAAAEDSSVKAKPVRVCDASFYSGELVLIQGAKEKAIPLFRHAASDCAKDFIEWSAALAELRAMGLPP
jgi:lipoprotein NlpI